MYNFVIFSLSRWNIEYGLQYQDISSSFRNSTVSYLSMFAEEKGALVSEIQSLGQRSGDTDKRRKCVG